ncbi:MAG: HD domain-containing protein [Candidatus Freyarchaeota archaeon]|nr:HD domain-containing protein [Candidatus Freyrarchaeum guaymaensis]
MQEKRILIKDPIYGYIQCSPEEKKIIDTEAVQRLRRIRQLAGSEFVYPAGVHTRFEHSLGVMHLAGLLASTLIEKGVLEEEGLRQIRIAALLHDVGHGPFSHVFEALLIRHLGKTHEDMTVKVITESSLKDVLNEIGLNVKDTALLAVGKLDNRKREFWSQIISSTVDCDKLDYILRDSYHTGGEFASIDVFRLIYTIDLYEGSLAVDLAALPTLEAFLIARLELFRSIYFHKASRAAQILLEKALEEAHKEVDILKLSAEEYLKQDDYTMWTLLLQCEKSREYIERLRRRDLLKVAYEKASFTKDGVFPTILTKDSVRRQLEEEIAGEASVDVGEVYIDVPTLPSVPYHHAMKDEPMEIPIFQRQKNGSKKILRLGDVSNILSVMRGFLNIIRVYTNVKNREIVAEASKKILGEPFSSKISY